MCTAYADVISAGSIRAEDLELCVGAKIAALSNNVPFRIQQQEPCGLHAVKNYVVYGIGNQLDPDPVRITGGR